MIKDEAAKFRLGFADTHPEMESSGYVLIFQGEAYAWRDVLRDPSTERPGVIAVDSIGRVFEAQGGDVKSGARAWVVINED